MYICDECLKKDYDNNPSFSKSYGRCECCGYTKDCNDIPLLFLRPIDRTVRTYAVVTEQCVGFIDGTKADAKKELDEMNKNAGGVVYYLKEVPVKKPKSVEETP